MVYVTQGPKALEKVINKTTGEKVTPTLMRAAREEEEQGAGSARQSIRGP